MQSTSFKLFYFLQFILLFSTELFASASYGCEGEVVSNLQGASSPASQSYVEGVDTAQFARYFKFKTAKDGQVAITQQSNKPQNHFWYHSLKIGTSCNSYDIYDGKKSKSDSKVINVTANTTYYVLVKENNDKNVLNFDINFSYNVQRDFELRNPIESRNTNGDFTIIGNTVLCVKNKNGACYDYKGNKTNNQLNLKYVDVDGTDATNTNFDNSSSAEINILPTAEIAWAAIYSQGRLKKDYPDTETAVSTLEQPMKITIPGIGTVDSIPDTIDLISDLANGYSYSTYSEVPQLIGKLGSEINGMATVAKVKVHEGKDNWGAWTLVLVYKDSSLSLKNISVFDGFRFINNNDANIIVNGFIAPNGGAISSKLSIFVGEGDKNLEGDKLYLNGTQIGHKDKDGTDNAFYSHISDDINNSPRYSNNQGIDIQTYNIGSTDGGLNLINHSAEEATIKFTSSGDGYFPSLAIFATDLYAPKFCYDYAYKQNDTAFTEPNLGDKDPFIAGTVETNKPIEVTIFLKNLIDSDVAIKNMKIDILDINTSQLTYTADTVKRALQGELYPKEKTDAQWGLNTSSSYIKDIPIGNQDPNESFYVYYTLNSSTKTDINDSINVKVNYDLMIAGKTINYNLEIGKDIAMCPTSSSTYAPNKGQFVIIHNPTYDANSKYNLPTQVTDKAGDFSVISIDDDFTNDADNLTNISTAVAIEMIDVGGFHYTEASCSEQDSLITDKVWLLFDNTSKTTFTSSSSNARQNTAFRVSYNVADSNGSLMELEKINNKYKFTNFPNYTTCNAQFGDGSQSVADNCNNTDGMTKTELDNCMECIYGLNSKFVCSRDNFAIRPKAFAMEFYDDNKILDAVSGNSSPSNTTSHLASSYKYKLNIKAITNTDANASLGYTTTYNNSDTNTFLRYEWTPSTPKSGCNDDLNKSISPDISSFMIIDGEIDINTSLNQVGEYTLKMLDKTWTQVDSNPAFMTHHDQDSYLSPSTTLDCASGSAVGVGGALNGCHINSEHTTSTGLQYKNYKIEFHPYQFNLNITASYGESNSTVWTGKPFIYMADLPQDEEMSFHLNGQIKATGYDGTEVLSNFVDGCYAYPISLDINKTSTSNTMEYKYSYHNNNNISLIQNGEINPTTPTVILGTNQFIKDQHGTIDTKLNLNFTRQSNTALNPQTIVYNEYKVKCQDSTKCKYQANLKADGTLTDLETKQSINQTLYHYYGRTHAPRQRFKGNNANVFIYYEVYCAGTGCDKSILPNGVASKSTNDPRWFINPQHTAGNSGSIGTVSQKYITKTTIGTLTPNSGYTSANITYNGTVFPYKATMLNTPSSWLVYNKYAPPPITTNEFEIEFDNTNSQWAGVSDTNSTTTNGGSKKTNRRIMW